MIRRLILHLFFLTSVTCVFSQELDCSVKVDGRQVQIANNSVFEEMEKVFSDFMSDRNWTNHEYKTQERIKCNLIITLSESPSIGSYRASVQIVSARPTYKSTYETVLLNFADRDWEFDFIEGQPIYYTANSFTDNLSSLLAFYAYVILGLDYDSFSELGGTDHYNKAWEILTLAQSSNRPGWNQFGQRRSRYWLIENLRNTQLEEIRKANYEMHRKGLDLFSDNQDAGRDGVLSAIKKIAKVNSQRANAPAVLTFFDTKASELGDIFSQGNQKTRQEAYDILVKVDPSNANKYDKILE